MGKTDDSRVSDVTAIIPLGAQRQTSARVRGVCEKLPNIRFQIDMEEFVIDRLEEE